MRQKSFRHGILIFALLMMLPGPGRADTSALPHPEDNTILDLSAGYRWVGTHNSPNRAAEYSYLEDSPTAKLTYRQYVGKTRYSLAGDYLNKNDYFFDGNFDYKALVRLEARTERLYHNLDHVPYQGVPEARPSSPATDYLDQNPYADYGRRVTFDEVKLRGKLPSYPAHINLSYWRLEKEGKQQLRFVDESCFGTCHMQGRTQKVDMVTEEVTAGFDIHLGPADIAFLQTLREFREKGDATTDDFNSHVILGRPAGAYVHDEAPDSKLTESTFMVNLPPSGGFVSSASYTFGKRENQADMTNGYRDDPETQYQKLAADATYTPGENWTVNFRYRMLDLDNDSPATLTSTQLAFNNFGSTIPVRESIDIDRNNYAAVVSYRPTHRLTFKGEFEREDVNRNNTGTAPYNSLAGISNPDWAVPDNEETNRFRLSFFSRLLDKSALKLNGWVEHTNIDNPAYGTSLSESNELFFSVSYTPSTIWGATGSIDILQGKNDDLTATQFDNGPVTYDLDRDEHRENLALGVWVVPNDVFSADLNYGWLRSKIDQDLLFGNEPDTANPGGPTDFTIADSNADYKQRVQTLSAGINLRVIEDVNCRLEGYHIRSYAKFSPGFNPRHLDYNTGLDPQWATADALQEISKVDIRQNGVKARLRWKLSEMLTAGFEYTYDDYDDKDANAYDGSAQTFIASLTGSF